jgi:hypothetical protein
MDDSLCLPHPLPLSSLCSEGWNKARTFDSPSMHIVTIKMRQSHLWNLWECYLWRSPVSQKFEPHKYKPRMVSSIHRYKPLHGLWNSDSLAKKTQCNVTKCTTMSDLSNGCRSLKKCERWCWRDYRRMYGTNRINWEQKLYCWQPHADPLALRIPKLDLAYSTETPMHFLGLIPNQTMLSRSNRDNSIPQSTGDLHILILQTNRLLMSCICDRDQPGTWRGTRRTPPTCPFGVRIMNIC